MITDRVLRLHIKSWIKFHGGCLCLLYQKTCFNAKDSLVVSLWNTEIKNTWHKRVEVHVGACPLIGMQLQVFRSEQSHGRKNRHTCGNTCNVKQFLGQHPKHSSHTSWPRYAVFWRFKTCSLVVAAMAVCRSPLGMAGAATSTGMMACVPCSRNARHVVLLQCSTSWHESLPSLDCRRLDGRAHRPAVEEAHHLGHQRVYSLQYDTLLHANNAYVFITFGRSQRSQMMSWSNMIRQFDKHIWIAQLSSTKVQGGPLLVVNGVIYLYIYIYPGPPSGTEKCVL